MRMQVCYLDCHEAGLTQKTYYVHYSYYTSICDPFTTCPSYIQAILRNFRRRYRKLLISYLFILTFPEVTYRVLIGKRL
jgi:hypothetical protein